MYRIKNMTDQEWAEFQRKFLSICKIVLNARGKTAVFVDATDVERPRAILISGRRSEALEALTPGGWEDCVNAADRRWTLLAGTSTSIMEFGLTECSECTVETSEPIDLTNYRDNVTFSNSAPRDEYRVN